MKKFSSNLVSSSILPFLLIIVYVSSFCFSLGPFTVGEAKAMMGRSRVSTVNTKAVFQMNNQRSKQNTVFLLFKNGFYIGFSQFKNGMWVENYRDLQAQKNLGPLRLDYLIQSLTGENGQVHSKLLQNIGFSDDLVTGESSYVLLDVDTWQGAPITLVNQKSTASNSHIDSLVGWSTELLNHLKSKSNLPPNATVNPAKNEVTFLKFQHAHVVPDLLGTACNIRTPTANQDGSSCISLMESVHKKIDEKKNALFLEATLDRNQADLTAYIFSELAATAIQTFQELNSEPGIEEGLLTGEFKRVYLELGATHFACLIQLDKKAILRAYRYIPEYYTLYAYLVKVTKQHFESKFNKFHDRLASANNKSVLASGATTEAEAPLKMKELKALVEDYQKCQDLIYKSAAALYHSYYSTLSTPEFTMPIAVNSFANVGFKSPFMRTMSSLLVEANSAQANYFGGLIQLVDRSTLSEKEKAKAMLLIQQEMKPLLTYMQKINGNEVSVNITPEWLMNKHGPNSPMRPNEEYIISLAVGLKLNNAMVATYSDNLQRSQRSVSAPTEAGPSVGQFVEMGATSRAAASAAIMSSSSQDVNAFSNALVATRGTRLASMNDAQQSLPRNLGESVELSSQGFVYPLTFGEGPPKGFVYPLTFGDAGSITIPAKRMAKLKKPLPKACRLQVIRSIAKRSFGLTKAFISSCYTGGNTPR